MREYYTQIQNIWEEFDNMNFFSKLPMVNDDISAFL